MDKRLALFYILINLILLSCGGKGTITEVGNLTGASEISVEITSVEISNSQLVLSGSGFDNVTNVQITGPSSFDETFNIEFKSNDSLTANGNQAVSFSIGSIFNLILSNAFASASFSITFTLQDGVVEARHLDDMDANDGDVLSWDDTNTTWEPASLNGLNYKGTWDVSELSDPPTNAVGDYYYVSVSGNYNLDGITDWVQGDWAISTGTIWQKIDNSTLVPSVFGRTGEILPETNDYTWEQIDKSNSTLGGIADIYIDATPADGEVLGWNEDEDRWEPMNVAFDTASVTSDELANSSVTSDKIVDYTITASDIATNAISYSRLDIGSGELSIDQIDSLEASLNANLSLVGGTMTGDINMNSNDINSVGTIDGVDISALNSSVVGNISEISSLNSSAASNTTSITTLDSNKQDNITSSTDLTVQSLTTATQAAIILEPYGSSASQTAEIHFKELSGNEDNYVGFRAPNLIETNLIWTLPATDGADMQVLQTDGNGNLNWANNGVSESDSIDSSHIQDNAITASEIATSAVGTTEIDDNSVTVADLEFASTEGIDIPQLATNPAIIDSTEGQTYYNTANNNIMYFDGSSWVEVGSGSGNSYSLDAADGSPTSVVYVDTNGNVGIGTTSPIGKLNIAELDAGVNSAGDGSSLVLGEEGGVHLEMDSNEIHAMDGSSASVLYLNNDGGSVNIGGNVGIGTTSPDSSKLYVYTSDVSKGIATVSKFTPNLTADSSTNYHASWNTIAYVSDYNHTGGMYSVVNRFQTDASSSADFNITRASLNDLYHYGTGTITTASGSANSLHNLSTGTISNAYSGYFRIVNTGGGTITNGYGIYIDDVTATNDYGIYQSVSDDDNYFAGNVGIGATSPSSTLSIGSRILFDQGEGDVSVGPDMWMNAQGLIATESNFYLNVDSDNNGSGDLYVSTGDVTNGATKLLVVKNSGNVGIGTTIPNANLHINGTDSSPQLKIYGSDDIRATIYVTDGATYFYSYEESPSQSAGLGLGGSSTNPFVYISSGNVGIGTTSPDDKLEVSGAVKATSFEGDGSALTNLPSSSSGTNVVYKSADESVTSSTTLQDDNHLKFAMEANSTYQFEFVIFLDHKSAPDFKFSFSVPSSPTNFIARTLVTYGGNTSSLHPFDFITSYSTVTSVTTTNSYDIELIIRGTIENASSSGNLVFRWAQNSSSTTSVKIYRGSYVKYTKIP